MSFSRLEATQKYIPCLFWQKPLSFSRSLVSLILRKIVLWHCFLNISLLFRKLFNSKELNSKIMFFLTGKEKNCYLVIDRSSANKEFQLTSNKSLFSSVTPSTSSSLS